MNEVTGMQKALALGGDGLTMADVVAEIRNGTAQTWGCDGAWIITRINTTPRCKTIHFWLAAGEKNACIELQRQILIWARSEGCTRATMHGRKGWIRALETEGWKQPPKLVVLEKEL